MLTLRELCESLNISRRTVQGYEELGLVAASDKNNYGYLLYDDEATRRISNIRFYQQLGFSRKEIKDIIDAPPDILKKRLKHRVKALEKEQNQRDELIKKAYEILESL